MSKGNASGHMSVTLEVVPNRGNVAVSTHQVAMTATTLGELAQRLSLDLNGKSVLVNGVPATLESAVAPGATVSIRVTERPKGS